MDPIAIEDLALLEVLQRVDQCLPLESGDTKIHQRLIDSGLVTVGTDPLQLTSAGIELCKSLQHRVAADAQAAKIVEQRQSGDAAVEGNVSGSADLPMNGVDPDSR
ncbi:hypothetical protein [Luteimonas lutimaris]|uniref:Preprotein translocase subunit SecA n=1 Tax=Luteimonas lutimaris TaxID=698645 RepID=A0ABP7MJQ1_9GAMM|nr:hypothetical protein [Luteimonas sp.]